MIAAVESCSFVDFPGRLAAVAFTQGCDLRCRYCHNPELCEHKSTNPQVTDEFLHLLSRRRGLLSGVVVSGGEPTLWSELTLLLRQLRSMGFATKLDTNGLHPERTSELVERGLVDYLAVDIKAAPGERCRWLCGHARQAESAIRTLAEASRLGVACEARTVLVDGIHEADALSWIVENLADSGIKCWRLRNVRSGKRFDRNTPMAPPERDIAMRALALADKWSLDAEWLG